MTISDEMKLVLSEKLQALYGRGQDGIAGLAGVRGTGEALVADALTRVSNATYGLCVSCEQHISPKRLAALPWVRYCMACQDAREGFPAEVSWNTAV